MWLIFIFLPSHSAFDWDWIVLASPMKLSAFWLWHSLQCPRILIEGCETLKTCPEGGWLGEGSSALLNLLASCLILQFVYKEHAFLENGWLMHVNWGFWMTWQEVLMAQARRGSSLTLSAGLTQTVSGMGVGDVEGRKHTVSKGPCEGSGWPAGHRYNQLLSAAFLKTCCLLAFSLKCWWSWYSSRCTTAQFKHQWIHELK